MMILPRQRANPEHLSLFQITHLTYPYEHYLRLRTMSIKFFVPWFESLNLRKTMFWKHGRVNTYARPLCGVIVATFRFLQ